MTMQAVLLVLFFIALAVCAAVFFGLETPAEKKRRLEREDSNDTFTW